jgi:hypothetical protein
MEKYTKKLVTWESNWDGEMDISGFAILSNKDANQIKANLKKIDFSFTICVGTNEEIDYSSGKDMLREMTFKPLTDEEAVIIKKKLGNVFGFWVADQIESIANDPVDEEDLEIEF